MSIPTNPSNSPIPSSIHVSKDSQPYGIITLSNGEAYKVTIKQASHLHGKLQEIGHDNFDPKALQGIFDTTRDMLNAHLTGSGQKTLGDYFMINYTHRPDEKYQEHGHKINLPFPWYNKESGWHTTTIPFIRSYASVEIQNIIYCSDGDPQKIKVIRADSPELQSPHIKLLGERLHKEIIEKKVTPHTSHEARQKNAASNSKGTAPGNDPLAEAKDKPLSVSKPIVSTVSQAHSKQTKQFEKEAAQARNDFAKLKSRNKTEMTVAEAGKSHKEIDDAATEFPSTENKKKLADAKRILSQAKLHKDMESWESAYQNYCGNPSPENKALMEAALKELEKWVNDYNQPLWLEKAQAIIDADNQLRQQQQGSDVSALLFLDQALGLPKAPLNRKTLDSIIEKSHEKASKPDEPLSLSQMIPVESGEDFVASEFEAFKTLITNLSAAQKPLGLHLTTQSPLPLNSQSHFALLLNEDGSVGLFDPTGTKETKGKASHTTFKTLDEAFQFLKTRLGDFSSATLNPYTSLPPPKVIASSIPPQVQEDFTSKKALESAQAALASKKADLQAFGNTERLQKITDYEKATKAFLEKQNSIPPPQTDRIKFLMWKHNLNNLAETRQKCFNNLSPGDQDLFTALEKAEHEYDYRSKTPSPYAATYFLMSMQGNNPIDTPLLDISLQQGVNHEEFRREDGFAKRFSLVNMEEENNPSPEKRAEWLENNLLSKKIDDLHFDYPHKFQMTSKDSQGRDVLSAIVLFENGQVGFFSPGLSEQNGQNIPYTLFSNSTEASRAIANKLQDHSEARLDFMGIFGGERRRRKDEENNLKDSTTKVVASEQAVVKAVEEFTTCNNLVMTENQAIGNLFITLKNEMDTISSAESDFINLENLPSYTNLTNAIQAQYPKVLTQRPQFTVISNFLNESELNIFYTFQALKDLAKTYNDLQQVAIGNQNQASMFIKDALGNSANCLETAWKNTAPNRDVNNQIRITPEEIGHIGRSENFQIQHIQDFRLELILKEFAKEGAPVRLDVKNDQGQPVQSFALLLGKYSLLDIYDPSQTDTAKQKRGVSYEEGAAFLMQELAASQAAKIELTNFSNANIPQQASGEIFEACRHSPEENAANKIAAQNLAAAEAAQKAAEKANLAAIEAKKAAEEQARLEALEASRTPKEKEVISLQKQLQTAQRKWHEHQASLFPKSGTINELSPYYPIQQYNEWIEASKRNPHNRFLSQKALDHFSQMGDRSQKLLKEVVDLEEQLHLKKLEVSLEKAQKNLKTHLQILQTVRDPEAAALSEYNKQAQKFKNAQQQKQPTDNIQELITEAFNNIQNETSKSLIREINGLEHPIDKINYLKQKEPNAIRRQFLFSNQPSDVQAQFDSAYQTVENYHTELGKTSRISGEYPLVSKYKEATRQSERKKAFAALNPQSQAICKPLEDLENALAALRNNVPPVQAPIAVALTEDQEVPPPPPSDEDSIENIPPPPPPENENVLPTSSLNSKPAQNLSNLDAQIQNLKNQLSKATTEFYQMVQNHNQVDLITNYVNAETAYENSPKDDPNKTQLEHEKNEAFKLLDVNAKKICEEISAIKRAIAICEQAKKEQEQQPPISDSSPALSPLTTQLEQLRENLAAARRAFDSYREVDLGLGKNGNGKKELEAINSYLAIKQEAQNNPTDKLLPHRVNFSFRRLSEATREALKPINDLENQIAGLEKQIAEGAKKPALSSSTLNLNDRSGAVQPRIVLAEYSQYNAPKSQMVREKLNTKLGKLKALSIQEQNKIRDYEESAVGPAKASAFDYLDRTTQTLLKDIEKCRQEVNAVAVSCSSIAMNYINSYFAKGQNPDNLDEIINQGVANHLDAVARKKQSNNGIINNLAAEELLSEKYTQSENFCYTQNGAPLSFYSSFGLNDLNDNLTGLQKLYYADIDNDGSLGILLTVTRRGAPAGGTYALVLNPNGSVVFFDSHGKNPNNNPPDPAYVETFPNLSVAIKFLQKKFHQDSSVSLATYKKK